VKSSAVVPRWAGQELARMGPVTRRELTMALIAVLALGLWIFGDRWLNATTVALIAFSLMLLTGVVDWADVLADREARSWCG
jgi:L-tartrate/succinate antiporter